MTGTPGGRRSRVIAALIACFYAGAFADWWLRERAIPIGADRSTAFVVGPSTTLGASPSTSSDPQAARRFSGAPASNRATNYPVGTTGEPPIFSVGSPAGDAVGVLQTRALRVPIDGVDVETMKGSFDEHRSGAGGHEHDAVDILAARNTAIHAVDDGSVAKLFYSKAGGTTVYQFDPSQRFCYYYAHLERYADGLRDGQPIARGDVIGYVGTSGNAPPGTPHLHFAVYELTPERRWWQGRAIDPYLVFRH